MISKCGNAGLLEIADKLDPHALVVCIFLDALPHNCGCIEAYPIVIDIAGVSYDRFKCFDLVVDETKKINVPSWPRPRCSPHAQHEGALQEKPPSVLRLREAIEKALEETIEVDQYDEILADVASLLEDARRAAARSVNAVMTITYWQIGRCIFEHEQGGQDRAGYGEELLKRLSEDLGDRFGRGFSLTNLKQFRKFYLVWLDAGNSQTASDQLPPANVDQEGQTPSDQSLEAMFQMSTGRAGVPLFPLTWSHYVCLMSVKSDEARRFYEKESLRTGWTVRQLRRQVSTQFYERTALSRDKAAMLEKGAAEKPSDKLTPEEEIKDPYLLEFLNLKDEYSEFDLEEALIRRLEEFLLELGAEFTFVGRQRRLRIGDTWYRVDLVFFHRRLRCLVIIDLKLGELTHADTGQMHLYCNYAREHWTLEDENPPVGLILCAQKDAAIAHYALEGLQNK